MTRKLKIVHITPHLGGGIGKALLTLTTAQGADDFEHHFLLLDRPEKTLFVEGLRRLGCTVDIASDARPGAVLALLSEADVVQLEWWNHPATFEFLCRTDLPTMRLLVWSHVSGLRTPVIPGDLIKAAERFVFTSPCSLQAAAVKELDAATRARTGVVSSGVGLAAQPVKAAGPSAGLRVGYVGSLNFSKLHPHFIDYLARVELPRFQVEMWGDVQNREVLHKQCREFGKDELLIFRGFTDNVAASFANLDVIPYLLNPAHYGTGENTLIEAMSAGVVPVVLDNPAERAIVENGRTGLVVNSPASFAAAISWLAQNPEKRREMAATAMAESRLRFSAESMGKSMALQYRNVIDSEKRHVNFRSIFGNAAADWFLCCQESGEDFAAQISALADDDFNCHGLHEASKGSLQHFLNRFPDDPRLQQWAQLGTDSISA